jgi:hypothetical protein
MIDASIISSVRTMRSGGLTLPERFQAKWKPVRVKKTRQMKILEPRFDSIEAKRLQPTIAAACIRGLMDKLLFTRSMEKYRIVS